MADASSAAEKSMIFRSASFRAWCEQCRRIVSAAPRLFEAQADADLREHDVALHGARPARSTIVDLDELDDACLDEFDPPAPIGARHA